MISGFVLLGAVQRQSVAQFVLARIVRLYPAYWVALLLLTGVLWLVPSSFGRPSLVHLAANLTMMQQFLRVCSLDGVYWTLAIELKFYALLLAVRYVGGLRYLPLLLGAWLGLVAWRLLGAGAVPHLLETIFFPDYAAYFVVGLTFGLLAAHPRRSVALLALLLAGCGLAVASAWQEAVGEAQHFGASYSRVVIGLVLTSFFLVFAAAVSPYGQRLRPGAAAGLAALGSLTYPIYLLHHNLGYVAFQRIGAKWPPYGLLTALVVLLLLAAYGLHRYLERPLARWLRTRLRGLLPGKPIAERTGVGT